MTHIENVPHVLKYGLTHFLSPNANPHFVSIGDKSLISTRSKFRLDNGKNLGDYIPFYFGVRMPMLYVIQKGYNLVKSTPPSEVVYCVTSVGKIVNLGLDFVFTDGHAVDSFTTQYGINDIGDIDNLIDKKAIGAKYWKDENDLDLKRRKEAEFLVLGDVSPACILGYVVYNQAAKERLVEFGVNEAIIYIKPDYYF